jgi:hypothetical protein
MLRLFELIKSNNNLKFGIPAFLVLILFIVISISLSSSPNAKVQSNELTREPLPVGIDANDLYLPDESSKVLESYPVFYRERKEVWSKEDCDRYWTDPRKISLDILRRNNEKLLEKMLSELP